VVEQDQTIDIVIRWDHRITDAALIAKVLTRLEAVLNVEIAAELCGGRQQLEPGMWRFRPDPTDNAALTVWVGVPTPKKGAFSLTGQRFLPRTRLLAGRFRPAMRFATRGPSLQA
jgi:hypothetical protein